MTKSRAYQGNPNLARWRQVKVDGDTISWRVQSEAGHSAPPPNAFLTYQEALNRADELNRADAEAQRLSLAGGRVRR